MNARQVLSCWWPGWRALGAVFVTLVFINLLNFGVSAVLPDNAWLQFTVSTALLVAVGPFVAWYAFQAAFRSRESREPLPKVAVASFSDEPSAHIAASVLGHNGISAVISSGSIGSWSGLAVPAGSVRLLVSVLDRKQAELVLAGAREHRAGP